MGIVSCNIFSLSQFRHNFSLHMHPGEAYCEVKNEKNDAKPTAADVDGTYGAKPVETPPWADFNMSAHNETSPNPFLNPGTFAVSYRFFNLQGFGD